MEQAQQPSGAVEAHGPFRVIRAGAAGEQWGDYRHTLGLSGATVGARGLSMDLQTIPPGSAAAPHRHAGFEVGLFILAGRIVHCYGPGMGQCVENGPGDFLYVAPDIAHTSFNPSDSEPCVLIVARTTPDGHAGNVFVDEA